MSQRFLEFWPSKWAKPNLQSGLKNFWVPFEIWNLLGSCILGHNTSLTQFIKIYSRNFWKKSYFLKFWPFFEVFSTWKWWVFLALVKLNQNKPCFIFTKAKIISNNDGIGFILVKLYCVIRNTAYFRSKIPRKRVKSLENMIFFKNFCCIFW